MKLFLVKSDVVKARYFFTDEEKAQKLFAELLLQSEDVVIKYLKTSDEWSVEELAQHFEQSKQAND